MRIAKMTATKCGIIRKKRTFVRIAKEFVTLYHPLRLRLVMCALIGPSISIGKNPPHQILRPRSSISTRTTWARKPGWGSNTRRSRSIKRYRSAHSSTCTPISDILKPDRSLISEETHLHFWQPLSCLSIDSECSRKLGYIRADSNSEGLRRPGTTSPAFLATSHDVNEFKSHENTF
jgi:hypothetical protein